MATHYDVIIVGTGAGGGTLAYRLAPSGKRILPLRRIGTPDDIARACVFLATNDFTTGTVLSVDGGEGLARRET